MKNLGTDKVFSQLCTHLIPTLTAPTHAPCRGSVAMSVVPSVLPLEGVLGVVVHVAFHTNCAPCGSPVIRALCSQAASAVSNAVYGVTRIVQPLALGHGVGHVRIPRA